MILGVNAIRLVTPRSGVARYLENLLRAWGEVDSPFDEIRIYTPRPLPEDIVLGPRQRSVVVPGRGPNAVWEQLHLPRAHGRRHLMLCASYVAPIFARCPLVVVHHGSYEGYEGYRRDFPWHRRLGAYHAYRMSARRAELVITVSESSRRDILRFYGVEPADVRVVPYGVDHRVFRPIQDAVRLAAFRRRVVGADRPLVIYVGKPIRRHNLGPMLEAFARLVRRGLPHHFLFVGSGLPGIAVEPLVDRLGLGDRVTLVDHADHDFVAEAINASELLVYPSEYEGFGLPVLEAMACGTPAIALDNTAFREFAAGAALLAPSGDVDVLESAMREVLEDPARRRRMREAGLQRAQSYSWSRTAEQTMELLAEVAGRRPKT